MFINELKTWTVYNIEYLVTLFFVKISILAFYRRLSPAQGFQRAIKIVAGVVTVFSLIMVFVYVKFLVKCEKLYPQPKGCNLIKVTYAKAAINITTDIVIFLLPLPSLLSLQLNRRNQGMFRRKALMGFTIGRNGEVWSSAEFVPG